MMVTVVILGVLAAVALPTYRDNVAQGRRAEAKAALLEAAQYMERYANEFGSYSGSKAPTLPSIEVPKGATGSGIRYTIAIVNNAASFTLTAKPTGSMSGDKCGSYTITDTGVRGVTGASLTKEVCWK